MKEETTLTEEPKTCLECGQPLGAGRSDRKFCNEFCRIAHNNQKRKETQVSDTENSNPDNPDFRKVYDILIKNREILMMGYLYQGNTAELRDLLGRGFNLKYFTTEYTDPQYGTYKFCFDYGYQIHNEHVVIMERREEIFLPHHP
ncbi:hypothetical protein [Mucilaginibacter pedocola]|uniref:DUF2116 family Zn-ribbon domain-containing protein n=1 Tax=Mucilaginibacter pedocola TaxID=1792845 RepID=A0A1S9PBF9_9SPHI|nr:hypothetical protein [Mucilaginibacter pedocola]OOQ58290.1 hypothetical protein BC343_11695 [Mucilaginibacter pedocola]